MIEPLPACYNNSAPVLEKRTINLKSQSSIIYSNALCEPCSFNKMLYQSYVEELPDHLSSLQNAFIACFECFDKPLLQLKSRTFQGWGTELRHFLVKMARNLQEWYPKKVAGALWSELQIMAGCTFADLGSAAVDVGNGLRERCEPPVLTRCERELMTDWQWQGHRTNNFSSRFTLSNESNWPFFP